MKRMLTCVVLGALALLGSACDNTADSEGTDDSSNSNALALRQSPTALDDVVVGEDGLLTCGQGLSELELEMNHELIDLGDTWITGEASSMAPNYSFSFSQPVTYDSVSYEFDGVPLNVKAAYVVSLNFGEAKGTSKQPGVAEKQLPKSDKPAYMDFPDYERDFTALWQPGMEKAFSVNKEDFGHGHNRLDRIVLCLETT